jgi:hypothetical protein
MKPIKALLPVSVWLMRIGLILYAYIEYFRTFTKFHLDDLHFYIAALFLISAVVIFVTGIIYKAAYAVLSGLVITLISVYNIVENLGGGIDNTLVINIIIASLATYFLASTSGK